VLVRYWKDYNKKNLGGQRLVGKSLVSNYLRSTTSQESGASSTRPFGPLLCLYLKKEEGIYLGRREA